MKIGVLGTGGVGQTLGTKLIELGHEVRMGSREARNERAVAWAAEAGERASEGSFADAAEFGEIVVNATAGLRGFSRQHFLNFLPLPQGHGSFRPTLAFREASASSGPANRAPMLLSATCAAASRCAA